MHRTTQRLLALLLTWLVVMLPVQAQAPPDLARLIEKDKDTSVVKAAIDSLMAMKHAAVPAVPAIGKALKHKDFEVRFAAAAALAGMGSEAKGAPGQDGHAARYATPDDAPAGAAFEPERVDHHVEK